MGQGSPALATAGNAVDLVYQGQDNTYYFASYQETWSPSAEAVGANPQSFGPGAPALTVLGGTPIAVFVGSDNHPYEQERASGAWTAAQEITADTANGGIAPVVVGLTQGSDLLVGYVRASSGQIMASRRAGAVWSASIAIPGAVTSSRPALLALPDGGAALAYRGMDGTLYTAFYDGTSGTWSTAAPFSMPNVSTAAVPALAPGVGGDTAELAYVNSGGVAMASRLVSGSWLAPQIVGGQQLTSVTLAVAQSGQAAPSPTATPTNTPTNTPVSPTATPTNMPTVRPALGLAFSMATSPLGPIKSGSIVTVHALLTNHSLATQTIKLEETLAYPTDGINLQFEDQSASLTLGPGKTGGQPFSFAIGAAFLRGTYTLMLTATDGSGDTASASAPLTVS